MVVGSYSYGSESSAFHQLSVENGIFKLEKMKQKLKIPRLRFVAMMISDHIANDLSKSVIIYFGTWVMGNG